MAQRHFFATADDLLPVFEYAESKLELSYTFTGKGLLETPDLVSYLSGALLPSLQEPADSSSISCPTYLISSRKAQIKVREIPQSLGGTRYAVDQLVNPDSITFSHGGLSQQRVLIGGRVATVSDTAMAKTIQATFSKAIGSFFNRINPFYVGPQAEAMLDDGGRLTMAAQSPSSYDLRRLHK